MISKGHKRHAHLERPSGGKFHRVELGFIGAPCPIIQELCRKIALELTGKYELAYLDADHGEGQPDETVFPVKITGHERFSVVEMQESLEYKNRFLFNSQAAVLINGNHFKTDQQIIIIHREKENSLRKKLERLDNVKLIVLDEGETEIFPFLPKHLKNLPEIPVLPIQDVAGIVKTIGRIIEEAVPKMYGIVLAGGESARMGEDKGAIHYHGAVQREHIAALVGSFCEITYLATRQHQVIHTGYPLLPDVFTGLGPYGALLTAFAKHPNHAFLMMPCDVPLMDAETIRQLVTHRNPNKLATCFYNPETRLPEPLITIWEPRAYPVLLNFLSLGYSCLRKVLIHSDVEQLQLEDELKIFNANTPEDKEKALKILSRDPE